jgi:hypothetical protein
MVPLGALLPRERKEKTGMVDENNQEPPHHKLIRQRHEQLSRERAQPVKRLMVKDHPHHKHPQEIRSHGPQMGPNGRMMYHHKQSNHEMPHDLQMKLVDAHEKISDIHHRERTTSVPGNPFGGFPGLPNMTRVKDDIRRVRQAVIDDWHEENPDHRVDGNNDR